MDASLDRGYRLGFGIDGPRPSHLLYGQDACDTAWLNQLLSSIEATFALGPRPLSSMETVRIFVAERESTDYESGFHTLLDDDRDSFSAGCELCTRLSFFIRLDPSRQQLDVLASWIRKLDPVNRSDDFGILDSTHLFTVLYEGHEYQDSVVRCSWLDGYIFHVHGGNMDTSFGYCLLQNGNGQMGLDQNRTRSDIDKQDLSIRNILINAHAKNRLALKAGFLRYIPRTGRDYFLPSVTFW